MRKFNPRRYATAGIVLLGFGTSYYYHHNYYYRNNAKQQTPPPPHQPVTTTTRDNHHHIQNKTCTTRNPTNMTVDQKFEVNFSFFLFNHIILLQVVFVLPFYQQSNVDPICGTHDLRRLRQGYFRSPLQARRHLQRQRRPQRPTRPGRRDRYVQYTYTPRSLGFVHPKSPPRGHARMLHIYLYHRQRRSLRTHENRSA